MTLILTWLDGDVVCQGSDRRLTFPDGPRDGFNKQTCVQCSDGNVTIAYAGMAELGPPQSSSLPGAVAYSTDDMIVDVAATLAAQGLLTIDELVASLKVCAKHWAGQYWTRIRYRPFKRRLLSIVIAGFQNGRPFSLEISNAEGAMSGQISGPEQFKIVRHSLKGKKLYVHGARGAWTNSLRTRQNLESQTYVGINPGDRCERLAKYIIEAAQGKLANNLIGNSVIATEVHLNRGVPFDSVYCSQSASSFLDYAPNIVTSNWNLQGTCTASMQPLQQVFRGTLNKLWPRVV